ncbi:MAG: hypothetical protein Q4F79_07605 [Eubacteriales bacterium]|nr:hypothetical protein [Eubacteriales bacterium]
MAEKKKAIQPICKVYPGTRMLNGCAMDAASYERHMKAQEAMSAPAPVIQPTKPQPYDPFAQQQDFRAIAAKAFEDDRAALQPKTTAAPAVQYRPGTTQYVTQEQKTVLLPQETVVGEQMVLTGSGSYLTSGSYVLTSGSYLFSSGSYLTSSGSYWMGSGSYTTYGSDMHLLGGYGLDLI